MRSPTSSPPDLWETIADEATAESPLWAESLRPRAERQQEAVFSPLAASRLATGIETIYEGYLVHYGTPRLFAPSDRDTALLLGDYLYAHGLVRIAALGDVEAVRELAELIADCAHLRADGADGDGMAWARAAERLGDAPAGPGEVERALAAHARRVG
jgi:hypothetical protein